MNIKRGDIYYADLSPVVGSEQGGIRPVLIVQNDVGNRYSPTVIAAAITSQRDKTELPTHIRVTAEGSGLQRDSIILLEQVRTIDKKRLREKIFLLAFFFLYLKLIYPCIHFLYLFTKMKFHILISLFLKSYIKI